MTLHSEWPIFHIWTATSPLNRSIVSISISQLVRYMLGFARPGWTLASQQTSFGVRLACVAWRFCREHYAKTRGKACANERRIREKNITHVFFVVPAPISSWFLGPRPPDCPPILLSAPNQNRHATQARVRSSRIHSSEEANPDLV